jgi:hypothetical protein
MQLGGVESDPKKYVGTRLGIDGGHVGKETHYVDSMPIPTKVEKSRETAEGQDHTWEERDFTDAKRETESEWPIHPTKSVDPTREVRKRASRSGAHLAWTGFFGGLLLLLNLPRITLRILMGRPLGKFSHRLSGFLHPYLLFSRHTPCNKQSSQWLTCGKVRLEVTALHILPPKNPRNERGSEL